MGVHHHACAKRHLEAGWLRLGSCGKGFEEQDVQIAFCSQIGTRQGMGNLRWEPEGLWVRGDVAWIRCQVPAKASRVHCFLPLAHPGSWLIAL